MNEILVQNENDNFEMMLSFDEYELLNATEQTTTKWLTVNESIVTITNIPTLITTTKSIVSSTTQSTWLSNGRIQIILYVAILLLAIVGNALVILTLIQNRRMRTITNVFLLNLAVSDILLGVLCMPITLIGTLLRDFVFGEVMCKLLPYLQGEH